MALVSKQTVSAGGTTPTYAAASGGGDLIDQPQGAILIIRNGGGSSINATLVAPGTLPNGDAYPDKVLAVPNGAERWIKLGSEYTNADGQAAITWSGVTSVTFAAIAP